MLELINDQLLDEANIVSVLDHPSRGRAVERAEGIVAEERDAGVGQRLITVAQHDLMSVSEIEPFGAETGAHDRSGVGRGLEQL